jgi:hypothetical protein
MQYRALVRLNGDFSDWDEFSERLEALLGEYDENCTYSKVIVNENGELLTIYENKNETNVLGYYTSDGPVTLSRLG